MPDTPTPPVNPYRPPQQPGSAIPPLPVGDRKTLIIVMGILSIVAGLGLGCLGGIYAALPAILAHAPPEAQAGNPMDSPLMRSMMGMGGAFLVVTAVALIWLGIGAIRLRRWAGDLFLAGGWLFGVMFLLGILVTLFRIPETMAAMNAQFEVSGKGAQPEQMKAMVPVILVFSMLFTVVFYLLPPLTVILVFRLKSVKQTFAHYSRGPSWTERLALPVLIWWLWLATMCVSSLIMVPIGGTLYQSMGLVKESWQASAWMGAFAVFTGIVAWAVMAKKEWSWYASLAFTLAMGAMGWIFVGKMDIVELYRKMGMSEEQIKPMAAMYENGLAYKLPGLIMLAGLIIFLIVTKRFYRTSEAEEAYS